MSILRRRRLLQLSFGTSLGLISGLGPVLASSTSANPLPSWRPGPVKAALLNFVLGVATPGAPNFTPSADRIAVFDNDGTLWCEEPLIQVLFLQWRLRKNPPDPSALTPVDRALLDGNLAALAQMNRKQVMTALAESLANQTEAEFSAEVKAFFKTAQHPRFGVPLSQMVYQPMLELLSYLRQQGFQTWISSGGGIDFIRAISEDLYGIPPQQVIGSSLKKEFRLLGGKGVIWRLPEVETINDQQQKPVGINLHIGKTPIFAAGNVRSGGDIAMLTYSQSAAPSLQLLINHDDPRREFAYGEADQASLKAARANNWQVASIQKDWERVFPFG
ncbi:MAG: haloacid dehalogenase-like hydrolase [Cyanobacteria bacterium RI_101]|nr:haloacid dehalogenase-like hydrolase [Cyanobacteria bacterium RI_101]